MDLQTSYSHQNYDSSDLSSLQNLVYSKNMQLCVTDPTQHNYV